MALTKSTGASASKSVGLINGAEQTETNSNKVGTYTLTVSWTSDHDTYKAPTSEEKAALDGKQFTVTLHAQGNLVILKGNERGGSDNEVSGDVTVTITWNNSTGKFGIANDKFCLTDNSDNTATGYFSINPNNENGPEVDLASATREAQTSPAAGDVAKEGDSEYTYYVHNGTAWVQFTGSLHTADGIALND